MLQYVELVMHTVQEMLLGLEAARPQCRSSLHIRNNVARL
jgi:hypothetical protein